jgi:ketosteroid isomerase-like protein
VNTKEAFGKQPAPAVPPPITLNWAPTYGGVAESADLGFSTGPYVVEDHSGQNSPTSHGMFFSIWKKQSGGDWRVVVDMGVRLENAFSPLDAAFHPAPEWTMRHATLRCSVEAARAELLKIDQSFFDHAKSGRASQTWRKFLSEDARIYRQMKPPVVDRAALRSWVEGQDTALDGKPIKSDASKAADLGYCYGGYELMRRDGMIEKGYYTRVWRRNARGNWRIVFDVNNTLPDVKK